MGGQVVTTPAGERWRVRREWVPRYNGERVGPRLGRRFRSSLEWVNAGDGAGCALDVAEGIVAGIVVAIVVALVVIFVVPLVVVTLELLFVLLLVGAGLVAKVVFRRPWGVEAEALDGPGVGRLVTWRVVGWRASGAHLSRVAEALTAGVDVPPGGVDGQAGSPAAA